jgi:hypothetical protein
MSWVMFLEHGISKINTYHLCITFQMATHNSSQFYLHDASEMIYFTKEDFVVVNFN